MPQPTRTPIALPPRTEQPSIEKTLFACSTGGHLTELLRIEAARGVHPDSLWVTADTPQSRRLLHGRRVKYMPYVGPRDLKGTVGVMPELWRIMNHEPFDSAWSTGAAIATAALPLARMRGIPSTYVESVCRLEGPSTTGRLLERVPGVRLRTQHASWANERWKPYPSILDTYRSELRPAPAGPLRIFVTLGTIRGFRFDSVVDALLTTGVANADTVWQLGDTPRDDRLPGTVHDYLPPEEFARHAAEADVVVTHAGVGTLVELLAMGIYPVQVVRRASRGEHVDDHQLEIARMVTANDLAIATDGPSLTASMIERAAGRRIVEGAPAARAIVRTD